MKPTKLILLALFLMSAAALRAQQAVPVEGIVVATHDTAWYAAQIAAWEQEIRRHPKDETAWQNLFNAVYYRDMLAGRDWTAAADVARRMARKIPGTFTLHYCRFRSGAGPDPDRDLEQALALGADRYYAYDTFIAQLWLKGQFGRMDELARRYFASGYLPTDLLRYNVQNGDSLHTIRAELDNIEKYLYIQTARFQSRLQYTINVPEHIRSCRIPNMVLQPVVENALIHGISPKRDGGKIDIYAENHGDKITIFVVDNGNGFPKDVLKRLREKDGSGRELGLRITDQRIKQYYGDEYGLEVVKSDYSGSTVSITISKSLIAR